MRSTLPDGSSIFEKTRSKKRRPFTEEEDRALKAGYEKHGTVWATIVKDPVFQEQNRRSTDLRDRFRNAFPELYQAAGYKPRNAAKKKNSDVGLLLVRAATDDQLAMNTVAGPKRRRRAHTSQGLLRGGTKSVPQSAACSEDEDSSGGEDETEQIYKAMPPFKDHTPQPEHLRPSSDLVAEMDLETVDPLSEPLTIPDFLHSSSQSEITDSQSQTWSSGIDTPLHSRAWSTAAGSPTSSHLSSDYLMTQSPFHHRSDGMNTIGKSAWGTQDWFSANPRLDPTSNNHSSFFEGVSHSPSSPFSFHNLNHGVLDRYDLFPSSFPHDFTSEVGVGDSHSTFSDDIFPPNGFRGFTHHSNYAGDLIFGARSHHTQQGYCGSSFGIGTAGLGLSDVQPSVGIHPMQLHTPALPGIDEIELTGITLNDHEDVARESINVDGASIQEANGEVTASTDHSQFDLQSLDDLVDLSHELHSTPPCTPITQPRPLRTSSHHFSSAPHGRSISVPPSEARSGGARPAPTHADIQPQIPATRSIPLFHSLSQGHIDPPPLFTSHSLLPFGSSQSSDEFRASPNDLYNLPFLDLHYYSGTNAGGVGMGPFDSTSSKLESQHQSQHQRQDQVLDLAQPFMSVKSHGGPIPVGQRIPQLSHTPCTPVTPIRSNSLHHRVQSAVSPQDLLFRRGNDNKRKRASWDGGAS